MFSGNGVHSLTELIFKYNVGLKSCACPRPSLHMRISLVLNTILIVAEPMRCHRKKIIITYAISNWKSRIACYSLLLVSNMILLLLQLFVKSINSNPQSIINAFSKLSMLGKKFSRRHFEIFFLSFSENRVWHFVQIVSQGDNDLQEMSNPMFWEK